LAPSAPSSEVQWGGIKSLQEGFGSKKKPTLTAAGRVRKGGFHEKEKSYSPPSLQRFSFKGRGGKGIGQKSTHFAGLKARQKREWIDWGIERLGSKKPALRGGGKEKLSPSARKSKKILSADPTPSRAPAGL